MRGNLAMFKDMEDVKSAANLACIDDFKRTNAKSTSKLANQALFWLGCKNMMHKMHHWYLGMKNKR